MASNKEHSDAFASGVRAPNLNAYCDGIVPLQSKALSDTESLRSESQATVIPLAAATSSKDKPKQYKRSWADEVDQAQIKKPNSLTNVPKFIIINSIDNQLTKMSPFFIQKGLQSIGGNPKNVKKLRSGDLLIETASPLQAKSFLSAKSISHIPINVMPHQTLNSSRGVISEFDLLHVSESEITEELSSQGVTQAKRITIKRGEDIINTKHLILTFDSPSLPKEIIAGYIRCPVRPYIPNPLRCFNCQRFGHSKNSCRGQETCSRCSAVGHSFVECQLEHKCVNCQGPHTSNSRACPKWIQEKQIQTIKCTQNISYPDARKQLISSQPQPNKSYASVLKAQLVSIAVQTEISIPAKKHFNIKGGFVRVPDPPASVASTSTNTESVTPNISSKHKILTHQKKSHAKIVTKSKAKKGSSKTKTITESGNHISDSSDSGEMDVEEGMKTPPNLLPKTAKPKLHRPPKNS